jgi:signal transduction histidine kinase
MRTLYLRVLLTLTWTLIFSLVALFWISGYIARRAIYDYFQGSMKLEVAHAEKAYITGGPPSLTAYLAEVDEALKGKRYLTDNNGRDLVTGADLSGMRPTGDDIMGFPKEAKNGQITILKVSPSKMFRLVVVTPPPLGEVRFLPYFLLVALAITLLGLALSLGIVSPLRRVADAVDRFGQGELSARVEGNRNDEIGLLARSFNGMADRIEALLTAERRLLQDVSHELRSPLARLDFAVELMKDAPDPEAATNRIRREIERLTQLVSTLMEVTSAEREPASRRMQRVAIPCLVNEIVADCGVEAEARNVAIDTEVRSSAEIAGDPELLRRAVENVLRNAIRFAPEGSRVSVDVEDKNGKIAVRIRDSGPGAPAELLARIFDPFFRVDESRDSAAGGSGLGLSIARRAVLLHHGEITAENATPGLRVNIVIPCA